MKAWLHFAAVGTVLLAGASQANAAMSKEEGLALAKASGCLACHSIDHKVVGPAWKDVSEKYKNEIDKVRPILIKKVHTGGKGNWTKVTGGVPMPPYSPRVSDANIEKLVDFVLSLSKM